MRHDIDFIGLVIANVEGVKSSTTALIASGMQLELAAHLMLQCASLGKSIILRSGIPPVYNQKRGPKSPLNKTKTSQQGLLKGSIAADVRFGRLLNGDSLPLSRDDARRLALDIHHPEHQHTIQLTITMQDILRELSPEGELNVLGYENGQLRLGYKEGRGHKDFRGQFIIDLLKGHSDPVFHSRPWDRPDSHRDWNPKTQTIRKPDCLNMIPDEVYQQTFSNLFGLNYTEHQRKDCQPEDIKEVLVFANTPKTSVELLNAIKETKGLNLKLKTRDILNSMDANTNMFDILAQLNNKQIKILYDSCGLITTGDWDGLLLGHPSLSELIDLPKNITRVYNTLKKHHSGYEERKEFKTACCEYMTYLKSNNLFANTRTGKLLQSINNPFDFFSDFSIQKAGCITPYEFVFTQLINYSYQDRKNDAYGEPIKLEALQKSLILGVKSRKSKSAAAKCPLDICLESYKKEAQVSSVSKKIKGYLEEHLKRAQVNPNQACVLPHPDYDPNVHELFQHGFEIRNPSEPHLDGSWLMISSEGAILYGETEEQLTSTLILGDFLEKNSIDIPDNVSMNKGWGMIVEKQLLLGQRINTNTFKKFQAWKASPLRSVDISSCDDLHAAACRRDCDFQEPLALEKPSSEQRFSFFDRSKMKVHPIILPSKENTSPVKSISNTEFDSDSQPEENSSEINSNSIIVFDADMEIESDSKSYSPLMFNSASSTRSMSVCDLSSQEQGMKSLSALKKQ